VVFLNNARLVLVGINYAGYPRSNKAGGSGGGEGQRDFPSTANNSSGSSSSGRKMKPSSEFNFTGGAQQGHQGAAAGHLSRISEDGAFPAGIIGDRAAASRGSGESSSGGATAARSYSGGFSIVGPWEESRDIITTLSAYDPQVCMATTHLRIPQLYIYVCCNARST